MADFTELPDFLLNPPEQEQTLQCENCGAMLLEGSAYKSYYSLGRGYIDFCGEECAVDYFIEHELAEEIVE